jgi:site-specific DNA-methyltransferase (adenine-specific)
MSSFLRINDIYCGDSRTMLNEIQPDSISISIWSPPYHVGKQYEDGQSYDEWTDMLTKVIEAHYHILKPGGFLAVNIADILCFPDMNMPKIQADNVSNKKCSVTREDILKVLEQHPDFNRYQLAAALGCSEQTIQRRMQGNNIRGGKHAIQTRVKIVGGLIEDMALVAGLYPYDRRIWVKDAAWANSNWTTNSYRAVDEFEYIYIFWKPGITRIDRSRLSKEEWTEWGSRAVWHFRSVQRNDNHEAKFPIELPTRLIKMFTEKGETVLDCFMGSGTTALAAKLIERNYIGIEKEAKYVEMSKRYIERETAQIRLQY